MDQDQVFPSASAVVAVNSWNLEVLVDSHVCAWCRSRPSDEPLKRCCGCDTVAYCGRQCQSAAWLIHRSLCRHRKLPAGPTTVTAGYPISIALAHAIREWCVIHCYAMNDLVHSMVRILGGAGACLRASRVFLCTVSSQRFESSLPDQNHALAFRLNRVAVREGEGCRQYYTSAALVELDEELTPSGPSRGSITEARAGVVPVLFALEGTESITTAQYPINRPLHHADDTPLGEEIATVFKDLRLLLANLINKGVVLCYPVDDCTADPPSSGIMVRTWKGWQWQYVPRFWQHLDTEMYRRKMPLQTSLVATDLYALFRQW